MNISSHSYPIITTIFHIPYGFNGPSDAQAAEQNENSAYTQLLRSEMLGIREEKGEPFALDSGASGGKKDGLFSRTGYGSIPIDTLL